jgi:hypothetical protein
MSTGTVTNSRTNTQSTATTHSLTLQLVTTGKGKLAIAACHMNFRKTALDAIALYFIVDYLVAKEKVLPNYSRSRGTHSINVILHRNLHHQGCKPTWNFHQNLPISFHSHNSQFHTQEQF